VRLHETQQESEFSGSILPLCSNSTDHIPYPRSAGIVRTLRERGDERELFGAGQ